MTLTSKLSNCTQFIYDLLFLNRQELGLANVWDGDMNLIGEIPALCVEAGPKVRELAGAAYVTDNTFVVYLTIYHGKFDDVQLNKRAALVLSEAVELLLHQNRYLGDPALDTQLVIHSFCTATEPGYLRKGNSFQYANRITWTGFSKTRVEVDA